MATTVEWELEGSAEYFEGQTTYKDGITYAELQIDSLTDETCGTYVCTASTAETAISEKTGILITKVFCANTRLYVLFKNSSNNCLETVFDLNSMTFD